MREEFRSTNSSFRGVTLEQVPQRLKGQPWRNIHYPNESAEYRAARDALLDDEIALRAQIEAVAAKRRALPLGGVLQDHVFEWIGKTSMPEKVKLVLYSFMYGPERKLPCPGCTRLLDGIDGAARHIGERTALRIDAKSPIARLAARAHERGWEHLATFDRRQQL
ncbi:DUF899 family protein [Bradyrhizobium sp. AUGA SZCCT0283]|uniref:DUF899 family protein n=1 Tax=Bradyrhizobium sp. AUGA SZCCT0283 TaxID=2807671 RepID=UPI0028968965|nr:DUF899 family protein [Bradyrhizobium sp. AUGA SZCCT0283]